MVGQRKSMESNSPLGTLPEHLIVLNLEERGERMLNLPKT